MLTVFKTFLQYREKACVLLQLSIYRRLLSKHQDSLTTLSSSIEKNKSEISECCADSDQDHDVPGGLLSSRQSSTLGAERAISFTVEQLRLELCNSLTSEADLVMEILVSFDTLMLSSSPAHMPSIMCAKLWKLCWAKQSNGDYGFLTIDNTATSLE